MTLTSANKDLEKYQLEAPFEWVIKTIDYQVWDNILSDSDKSVYIENPNLLQISISLDQVDIINVELWNKADMFCWCLSRWWSKCKSYKKLILHQHQLLE